LIINLTDLWRTKIDETAVKEYPSNSIDAAQFDVKKELDLLLISLQRTLQHSPNLLPTDESGSLSGILETIVNTDVRQLLQELKIAQTELAVLDRRNQDRVDEIDTSILQAKQLKFRTQQLAQHSKNQIEKAEGMLGSIEQIRTEIVTSLDKFGGYEEIQGMLAQLETTRHALLIAHDRATTGQEAFYDSLQAIQVRVAARSDDSEHKLDRYHESIESLSQSISTDRLRIAGISVDLTTKLTDLHSINAQIITMHAQIVEKSHTLQTRIAQIDRGFLELSQSVQTEKEQFYALTVESIEKADSIRSQLAEIVKQRIDDRDSISALKAELELVRQTVRKEAQQKLINFDVRDRELIAICNDLQTRQKDRVLTTTKIIRWLWILSVVVGVLFISLIRISISLK
jgi:hypothetical protein